MVPSGAVTGPRRQYCRPPEAIFGGPQASKYSEEVPDPVLHDPTDAIIRVTYACVCGSDLHPYHDLETTHEGRRMGHEAIGEAFGGNIVHAPRVMHGKESMIFHDNDDLFMETANPFRAIRYHSLVIDPDSLPEELVRIAWTDQDEIMGVRHREHLLYGIQFHPESILTESGKKLLANFLEIGGNHVVTGGIGESGRGASPDPPGNGRGNGRHHER